MCAAKPRRRKRRGGRANPLARYPGIGDFASELLYQEGFKSAEDVADSALEEILDVEGISKEKAEALHSSAKQYVAEKRAREAEAAAEAAAAAAAAAEAAASAASALAATPEQESPTE